MEAIRRKQIHPRTNQIRKAKKQTPFTKANILQTNKAIQPTRLLVRRETKLSNLPRPKQTTKQDVQFEPKTEEEEPREEIVFEKTAEGLNYIRGRKKPRTADWDIFKFFKRTQVKKT